VNCLEVALGFCFADERLCGRDVGGKNVGNVPTHSGWSVGPQPPKGIRADGEFREVSEFMLNVINDRADKFGVCS